MAGGALTGRLPWLRLTVRNEQISTRNARTRPRLYRAITEWLGRARIAKLGLRWRSSTERILLPARSKLFIEAHIPAPAFDAPQQSQSA
jgi:hypothetical protein